MLFSICLLEPEGYKYSHFLYDVCKYLCYTIETTGYECCMVKNRLYSDRINVILGAHNLTDPAIVEQIKQSGEYVIVQSEVLREDGMSGWPNQKTYPTIYLPLLRQARAVWEGLESNQIQLRKHGIDSERLPQFGYLPAMEEIIHKKNKDIDFLYYGSLTPHRGKMIEKLKALGGKVVYAFDEAAIFRNDLIARTRVNLAPNQAPGINHMTSKILYLINNRSIVVVERCFNQDWVEHCFPFADTEEWAELCMETLNRPDLDQLACEYYEQYKKLNLAYQIRPLIDKLRLDISTSLKTETSRTDEIQKPSESIVGEDDPLQPRFKEEAISGLTSIIILTCNHLDYTKKCVKSIRKHTPEAHEIIFVDNGSTDGTVKWLQGQVMENNNCRLIENKENVGWAKGRNQGITISKGGYILLIDNTVIVSEDWLSSMLECLNRAPAAGIVGPMTNNCRGTQQVTDESYRSVDYLDRYAAKFKEQYRHRQILCRNIAGFCMLFKRTLTEKIGLLDERFGTGYFEDEDFSLRAALEDYRNYIAGDVFIHHGDKTSTGDRNIIEKKWTLSTASPEGKKLMILKAKELADILYQKGEIDRAVEALIDCIKISPDNKVIYYELSRIFIESRKFSEALEVIGTMPDSAKNDLQGLECASYAKEGLGLDDEATTYANKMLSIDENCPAALNLHGVLAYKKSDKKKAANYFRKAIDVDPAYPEAYTNLGVLYWSIDKKDDALAHLQKGFVLSPTVPDLSSLYYTIVSSLGTYSDVENDFREACRLYPNNKKLTFLYIDALIQQGSFEAAMLKIEDALVLFGLDEGTLKAALAVREKIGPMNIEKVSKKSTLSLCMIVKNEEKNLIRCLKSVQNVVDEMIVVDTGSADKTIDIARVFGAKIFEFPWTGDFSAARNHSLAQATGDLILILDADEVISSLDFDELKTLLRKRYASPAAFAVVTRNYINNVSVIGWTPIDGQYPEEAGKGWVTSAKVRLFTRSKDVYFSNPVHEIVEGSLNNARIPVSPCNIIVHHYGKLDMERDSQKGKDYYLLGKIKYESDPSNVKYIYELARQAQVLDKYEEALELWLKLLSLIEDNPQSADYKQIANISYGEPLPEIYVQIAAAYLLLDRYQEALKAATKAMETKVKLKEYINIYAHCEIIVGSLEKAFYALEELLQTTPDYLPALFNMAAIFCLEGKIQKTQEYFQLLRQKGVQLTPLLNKMAKQLHIHGKMDEALLIINTTFENNLNDQETERLRQEVQVKLDI